MFSGDENEDMWEFFEGDDDQRPSDEEIDAEIERLTNLSGRLPSTNSDKEWARYPKRWSTMLMITELNEGAQYTESELAEAAVQLMNQARFECSWSEKFGELVFWPSDIPLDEVKRDVV